MDLRSEIIGNVLMELSGMPQEVMDKVSRVLHIELARYEVQERCTDLVIHDQSNYGLIKKFIATKRVEGLSENTIKRYYPELLMFDKEVCKAFDEVETFDIRYYLAMYKEKKKISNISLDNMRKVLSSFFGWACDEGLIRKNPAKAVKAIKFEKKAKKPLTAVEREEIKNHCNYIRDIALTEFLYATGLRVSEVVILDITDINFNTQEGIVMGKGSKERKFFISDVAASYLKRYLDSRTDDNPALFVSVHRPFKRLSKTGIEAAVKRIGDKAGVEKVHPHKFRRTLATNLARKDVPLQNIAKILGHEDTRTTQVYVSINMDDVRYQYHRAV